MAKRSDNFEKFVKQKKGSAIKEEIRQNKRKEKKDRAAAIEAHFERKRAERLQRQQPNTSPETKTSRPNKYPKKEVATGLEKPQKQQNNTPSETKTLRPNKYPRKEGVTGPEKIQRQQASARSETKTSRSSKYPQKEVAPGPEKPQKLQNDTPSETKTSLPNKYPSKALATAPEKRVGGGHGNAKPAGSNPSKNTFAAKKIIEKPAGNPGPAIGSASDVMPLNKYIAHSGICSRRDAAILVKEGKVMLNGQVATDPGSKVSPTDEIRVGNKRVTPSRNFVYILLNKPKDYITTSEDPQGRKTVLELVRTATNERVYPVGRLDRNTSGVLLLTNDGDLAQKLSHPKHEIKKVYEVRLDRVLSKGDLEKIAAGVTLEDGFIAPDAIAYADPKDKSIVGIEIHSGRNRIVRRIFEHLKYDVKGLDRVMFAGLTKKDVQRGKWRLLKEKEIRLLKYMNQSFVKIRE